jgi:UDP-N-acetylmuramyl pentapeptide synthase
VRNFVVYKEIDFSEYKDANIILVPDTLQALQQLPSFHRRICLPVIGITGSNGKQL